jgi:hypothetical protein
MLRKAPLAIAAPQRLGSSLTALCSRKAVPPSGSRIRAIYYLSIRPDQTSFVLLDSGLLGPPASND